jgi:hypothetical protein
MSTVSSVDLSCPSFYREHLDNQRSVEDWEADPSQDAALDGALALDEGPAAPRILAAIMARTH